MGRRVLPSIVVIILLIFFISNAFLIESIILVCNANPGNVSESWDNSTTLNVTVLQLQPRINWYDFQFNQSGIWVSRLNQQIDVNNSAEYRFIVNISSDQGWTDIDYVNITAWYDNGSETSKYNQTLGGNINLFLQYKNTTGTAVWSLQWPDSEVTFVAGDSYEIVSYDSDGSFGNTECYNLTFAFVPGYQFRHTPGDGSWGTSASYDDLWSWNFNITAVDQTGYLSYNNPIIGESVNEFGVYSYTEIVSVGWPTIIGNPGTTAIASSNITIQTRSNGNYSLTVDLDQLDHVLNPMAYIANTTVSLRGGNLTTVTPFSGAGPQYLWGTNKPDYQSAENNDTIKNTPDLEYRIAIPLAQLPGDYQGTLRYKLTTEL